MLSSSMPTLDKFAVEAAAQCAVQMSASGCSALAAAVCPDGAAALLALAGVRAQSADCVDC